MFTTTTMTQTFKDHIESKILHTFRLWPLKIKKSDFLDVSNFVEAIIVKIRNRNNTQGPFFVRCWLACLHVLTLYFTTYFMRKKLSKWPIFNKFNKLYDKTLLKKKHTLTVYSLLHEIIIIFTNIITKQQKSCLLVARKRT